MRQLFLRASDKGEAFSFLVANRGSWRLPWGSAVAEAMADREGEWSPVAKSSDDSSGRRAHGSWAVACYDWNCSRAVKRDRGVPVSGTATSAAGGWLENSYRPTLPALLPPGTGCVQVASASLEGAGGGGRDSGVVQALVDKRFKCRCDRRTPGVHGQQILTGRPGTTGKET
jgi:hypothetical protein